MFMKRLIIFLRATYDSVDRNSRPAKMRYAIMRTPFAICVAIVSLLTTSPLSAKRNAKVPLFQSWVVEDFLTGAYKTPQGRENLLGYLQQMHTLLQQLALDAQNLENQRDNPNKSAERRVAAQTLLAEIELDVDELDELGELVHQLLLQTEPQSIPQATAANTTTAQPAASPAQQPSVSLSLAPSLGPSVVDTTTLMTLAQHAASPSVVPSPKSMLHFAHKAAANAKK
jgi:hypothetical protein